MNKQIVRRFQEFAQANGIALDLEQIDFELVNLVDDNLGRITFNPTKDRTRVKDLIERKEKVSKVPMDSVDESIGMLKPILEEESIEKLDAASYRYFEEGDILWAKVTPCMENGNCAIANNLKNGIGYGSTEFHVFRAKIGEIDSKYLWYFLRNKDFREQAKPTMRGSGGLKRVPRSFLENQFLPIPIATQSLTSIQIQEILVRFIEHGQSAHQRRLDGCAIIRPILDKMERSVVPRTLEKSRGARKLIKEFLQENGIELDYEKVEFINEKLSSLVDFKGGHSKYTKEYIGKNPGEYPLLTGKLEENSIGAFIKDFDFEGPIITFNKDNASGSRSIFRNEGEKFAMNSHHVAAQLKSSSKIKSYKYLNFQLNQLLFEGKYGWENVASPANIGVLDVKIPKDLEQFSSHEIQKILAWFFESYLKRVNHNRRVADKLERQIAEYRETYLKLFFKSLKQKAHAD